MFWVCLYLFLFPDLSGEDKTQSADTGRSVRVQVSVVFSFGTFSFSVSDHWYMLRIVDSLVNCTIPAEVSANYLTCVQDCTFYQKFSSKTRQQFLAHWFVLFFFDLQLVRWCILGSVMLRCWQEQALYNAPLNVCQRRTLVRNSPLYASRLHLREWQWRTMNESKIDYHFLTIPTPQLYTSVRFVFFSVKYLLYWLHTIVLHMCLVLHNTTFSNCIP